MNKDQLKQLENDLWKAADNLRANSDLKASEYSTPVLGLIFLKFADNNYRKHESAILSEYQKLKGTRREKKCRAQSQRVVRSAVEKVLDSKPPETYERILFKEKCDAIFELMLEYASHGTKWVA
jgi:type I restriction-modification system DNA methylase subunit